MTTTHMALLCLLSARAGSGYELVHRTRRSIGFVWPRARSNLYVGLKRLVDAGLAEGLTGSSGRRPRTTYRITDRGRDVLARWLAAPGAGPVFECEALLKLGFAPATTTSAALTQIGVVREHAATQLAFGRALAERYLAGAGDEPERTHVNAVMWRYLWQTFSAMQSWAEWAHGEVSAWPQTGDGPDQRERGLAVLREALGGG